MGVPKIGAQTGIEAARQREGQLHADYKAAWDKRAATLQTLVAGHNEFIDRLAALEARPVAPFPFAASSTPPGG